MIPDYALGIVTGAQAGAVLQLGESSEVGQAKSSDVCLPEPSVAPRHAHLYLQGGVYHVVDLHSFTGTFVDGQRLTPGEPRPLKRGALLAFGEGGLLALFGRAKALRASSGLVLTRTDTSKTWPLSGPVEIGRGAKCGIQLDPQRDSLASSRHLHVVPVFGRAVLTDLGSANGTWRGSDRVVQCSIAPGESFVIGGSGGPTFKLEQELQSSLVTSRGEGRPDERANLGVAADAATVSGRGPAPIPTHFRLELQAGNQTGKVRVACSTEASFGSFAGLSDFETTCFPRDLESEREAEERSEAIGPQHGCLRLTERGVDLVDLGYAETKLSGERLPLNGKAPLPPRFQVALGGDALLLRGKLEVDRDLPPSPPAVGMERAHPVACLSLERMGDGGQSRLYLLLVRQATLGSSEDASIQVCAPGISPLHAALCLQDEVLWISQLGDAPVAVNGTPLSKGTALPVTVGGEVFLGSVRMRVCE